LFLSKPLAPPTETSAPNREESIEMEEKKRLIPQHDPPPSDVIIKVEDSQEQEGVQVTGLTQWNLFAS